jgi:hypothetical protein
MPARSLLLLVCPLLLLGCPASHVASGEDDVPFAEDAGTPIEEPDEVESDDAGMPMVEVEPPPTIVFDFAVSRGLSVDDESFPTTLTVPVPSPTEPGVVPGVTYAFPNLRAGEYDFTLEWDDATAGNRGWTASFGGYPGRADWPMTSFRITMSAPGGFGPQKVALVGVPGAAANTLTLTVRAVGERAATDYGVLRLRVLPAAG